MTAIDLNADLGEGGPADEELFAVVTSANVACGGHAGDNRTMERSLVLAKAHGVAAGAHPGYADRASMGRAAYAADSEHVMRLVKEQLEALQRHADNVGVALHHVKAHGALYHQVAYDDLLAAAFVAAVASHAKLPIVGPAAVRDRGGAAATALQRHAQQAGLPYVAEAFLDRGYMDDGRLVPRSDPGALIPHAQGVAGERAVALAVHQRVQTVSGRWLAIAAQTLCVHGDSPFALAAAREARAALLAGGVALAPPAGTR